MKVGSYAPRNRGRQAQVVLLLVVWALVTEHAYESGLLRAKKPRKTSSSCPSPCCVGIGDTSVSLRRQSCKIMKIRLPCRHAQTPLSLFPSTDLTSWTVRSRCATKRQTQPTSSHTQPGSAVVQQTGGAKPEELERFNTAEHSRLPWPSPRSRVDPISRA